VFGIKSGRKMDDEVLTRSKIYVCAERVRRQVEPLAAIHRAAELNWTESECRDVNNTDVERFSDGNLGCGLCCGWDILEQDGITEEDLDPKSIVGGPIPGGPTKSFGRESRVWPILR